MGGAAMLGLGVALAKLDVPVLVITGDGKMLMGMGSCSTIALQNPPNLTIAVLDNSLFGETGGQARHTASVTNLAQVAKACGVPNVREIDTMPEVAALAGTVHDARKGLTVADIKVGQELLQPVMTSRAGAVLVERTRQALGLPMLRDLRRADTRPSIRRWRSPQLGREHIPAEFFDRSGIDPTDEC
jgi:thiamine pyrophosphate-dependent acetolactate synthase large subunit-like protein